MIFHNPIIKGFHPDPSVCFDGQDFYLVTSTFEFFPGVPVFKSQNLVNWELIGHALSDATQCDLHAAACSGGIYAPTIRYHEGVYYMVTTNVSNGGHLIVHTKDPSATWSQPVFVDQDGIDPSLLFDDGKVYFVSTLMYEGRQAIGMCEIDPFTGEKYTETKIISYGNGGKYPEAPHLYKLNGMYYLMLAEGGTEYGHMVTMSRSTSPYGPFEPCPHNPILSHRNEQSGDIQCTGHADIVEDANGNWWMVCLGVRPLGIMLHNLGRETFLAPLQWIDGWPHVGNNGRIALTMDAPLPSSSTATSTDFFDDFESSLLKPQWTFIRNPDLTRYLSLQRGICLKGNNVGLDDPNPTFIGIRQTEFCTHTCVKMDTPDINVTAGLTAYYNAFYYYALRITNEDGCLFAELEKHLHDEKIIKNRIRLDATDHLTLHLYSDREYYRFAVETDAGVIQVGQGSTAGLSTEGTMMMTFTGVFIGLYAEKGHAVFRHFAYVENESMKESV